MPHIEHFKAVSISASQEAMDKVEAITPVFTYFEGGEIILDTRTFENDDPVLGEISEILGVSISDIEDRLVAIYV